MTNQQKLDQKAKAQKKIDKKKDDEERIK